jgi:hypothetical protein
MGKTHRQKPKLPRGPFRKNWDMPHSDKQDYKRSREKREFKKFLDEEQEDTAEEWQEEI